MAKATKWMLRAVSAFCLLSAGLCQARADTYTTFVITDGEISNGNQLSGNVVIDTTTVTPTSFEAFEIFPDNTVITFIGNLSLTATTFANHTLIQSQDLISGDLYTLSLDVSPALLTATTGDYDLLPSSSLSIQDAEGTITTFAVDDAFRVAPEPATLTMLGTGLLAIGAFRSRRWRRLAAGSEKDC